MSAAKVLSKPKKVRSCSSCTNHGFAVSKTGHTCQYKNCNCILCRLLRQSQKVMCHQQRFWRHQKMKLDNENEAKQKGAVCKSCKTLILESDKKHTKCADQDCACEKCNKKQVCDKCRNHNVLIPKKNHKCPFKICSCDYCSLTEKRRMIMQHRQKVRRCGVISEVNPEVKAAEDLLRKSQSELSSMKEHNSAEEKEVQNSDFSEAEREQDSLELLPQSSPNQNVNYLEKNAKLLPNNSPTSTNHISSQNEQENRQTLYDLPQLLPFEQPQLENSIELRVPYRNLSSPPQLIPVNHLPEETGDQPRQARVYTNVTQEYQPVMTERYFKSIYHPYGYNRQPFYHSSGAPTPQSSICSFPSWNFPRMKEETFLRHDISFYPFPIRTQHLGQRPLPPFYRFSSRM